MATNVCGDATRLLATYRAALAACDKARGDLHELAPEHITLQEAAQAREDATVRLMRARRAYWKHVDLHACRHMVVERSGALGKVRISLH